jgi:diadenosine tetraphosphatase ApaH/serine/threonine PP2A family protein phosphatase
VRALLYDVHGNLPALEAVLADAEGAGVTAYVLGGDHVFAGAWPEDTLARLRELDAHWIRGNTDRWLTDRSDAPEPMSALLDACAGALGPDDVSVLAGLPEDHVADGVHFCHAAPGNDMAVLLPDPRPEDAELIAGARERRLVFGHTHLQFTRTTDDGVELTNPGSVGIPCDGDHRAAYALWHDDGRIELRRVAYDHQASADAVRERFGEAAEVPARRIEQARFDV